MQIAGGVRVYHDSAVVNYPQCLGGYQRTEVARHRRTALVTLPGAFTPRGRSELAGQYFRIWPDATISIARITLSDTEPRNNWASRNRNSRRVVDLLPLVMALWSM
jgi:peroxiredoxin